MKDGDVQQGPIIFREADHSYWHEPSGRQLTAVSKVISTVYAMKSWDGVDPAVIENARVRGAAVDKYLSAYIRDGSVSIEGESMDVVNRVTIASRIYEEEFPRLPAEAQKIVYSLEDGVAGMLDFWIDNRIVADLKSTYSIEKSWTLQLGAYASYAPAEVEQAGIIHISPKVYREHGGIWIEYDVAACKRYWKQAVSWWQDCKELASAKR